MWILTAKNDRHWLLIGCIEFRSWLHRVSHWGLSDTFFTKNIQGLLWLLELRPNRSCRCWKCAFIMQYMLHATVALTERAPLSRPQVHDRVPFLPNQAWDKGSLAAVNLPLFTCSSFSWLPPGGKFSVKAFVLHELHNLGLIVLEPEPPAYQTRVSGCLLHCGSHTLADRLLVAGMLSQLPG